MQAEEQGNGLTTAEAQKRLAEYGYNTLFKPHTVRFVSIVREEITEPMILLLFAVGFFYALGGELGDTITIFAIIAALIFAEVWNEYRAKKTISSLSQLAAPAARVLRDGVTTNVKTELIVPGDVLLVTSGTRVAADAHVTGSFSLSVDESSLTGESFPQERKVGENIYAGTLVVAGEGTAAVFATGGSTKFGAISARAQEIKEPKTPLQLAMKSLAKSLVGVALAFSIAIPLLGFLRGQNLYQMFLT
ncbi:MAG: HAD-IC family P-type ATPase, partial [Halobacteriota archaeon]